MSNFPFPKPKIPPDLESRLPFIINQFMDPCDAPITVWIECMWPALLHALIAWYQVDMVQIFRTMWKPPLYELRSRSLGHGSRPGHGKKKGFGHWVKEGVSFDPNDFVGKELNPFAEYEMIELLPGEIWFWTGLELVTIALFYWSIIDISSAFLYEWTSGMSQSKYCHARDDAVLLAGAPGYPLQGIFGWDAIGVLVPLKLRNIFYFDGFGCAQNVGPGIVGVTFGYFNSGGDPGAWIRARLHCLTGPRAGVYAERELAAGSFARGDGGLTYDCASNEVWIGEILVNGGWDIIDPRLFMHARKNS